MNSNIATLLPELEKELKEISASGIFPSQKIEEMIKAGCISAKMPISDSQIQPASIDLRLGAVAYRVRASFLPGEKATVRSKVDDLVMHEIDLSKPSVLEKGCVYIVPLMEELHLPSAISGKANPKSTTGRLDVFTRLIVDHGTEFERVPPGYKGKLYVEVVPRTFSILIKEGMKLNQLRFVCGNGGDESDAKLNKLDKKEKLVYSEDDMPLEAKISQGLRISIDLQGKDENEIIGYRAKSHTPLVNLEKIAHYDPMEFWEPLYRPKKSSIVLNPNDFYILMSKEKVRVPPDFAAEMVAYDPAVGEFRIHYAGFFDPGFGYGNDDIKGTRAVLEVRSHEVPFILEDGQIVGRLIYERLLAAPQKIYGKNIGSSYQSQGLSLSKQFKRS
ncbi:MAG: 2'-deoxycytidine 5'-triphosphate deaminase [Deltaproteobacteria bacterium]|nr:2'-deoxycytidine 5'-triphosphate deaminase [Deltaproteobacteria bacterium]